MNWKNLIGVLIGIGLLIVVGFRLKDNKNTVQGKVYQYDPDQPIAVRTDTIRSDKTSFRKSFTGTFEPARESKISTSTQGEIISVLADEGDRVHKDQKLVLLDQSLLKINLKEADLKLKELRQDVDRYTILAEADAVQGLKLEKTKIGLETAEIKRSAILEQLSRTEIKAPFSGIVTARFNEIGGFVGPGMPLLQITDLSWLRFTIQVPEKDLKMFYPGQEIELTTDAFPEIKWTGKLRMIGSKANMANTYPIQFRVNNTKAMDIKAGMFGRTEIEFSRDDSGITIPGSAVIREKENSFVYLIEEDKAVLRPIKIRESTGSQVIVTEGLIPGDVLVTHGFINLFEGAAVRIIHQK